jgi:hypothetical protein
MRMKQFGRETFSGDGETRQRSKQKFHTNVKMKIGVGGHHRRGGREPTRVSTQSLNMNERGTSRRVPKSV